MPDDEFKKRKKADDCGCNAAHGDDDEFSVQMDVDETAGLPEGVDPRGSKVRKWSGLLAPYGLPTGDGRRFAGGALSSRDLPLPVKWQRTDNQGHSTSVSVGRIDAINYTDEGVFGTGVIFDPDPDLGLDRLREDAGEAWHLLQQKVIGPSVDLDDMDYHTLGDPAELAADARQDIEVTRGRISAVTLVAIPAFAEARPFALDEIDADAYASESSVTAAGVAYGMAELPVADVEWDPLEALFADLHDEDPLGHLYSRDGVHLFPVAQKVDGGLSLVAGAVADAVSVLAYHDEQVGLPEGVKQALREELVALTAACALPAPPWDAPPAALVAAAGARPAPRTAFRDPKLSGPTPLTITPDGRVYGHLATWGTCHIGFPGSCVTPPRSPSGYKHFHLGTTQTDDGPVKTGKITLGGGHADTRLGFQAAAEHYDDANAAVANVVAGEDAHGIWVAGMIRPGLDPQRVAELAASPLSGDWRRIGGGLEMIAALAVNTPGFPVPHARKVGREDYALVAAGTVRRDGEHVTPDVAELVAAAVADWRVREREQRAAARTFEDGARELDRLAARRAALAFD